MELLDNVNITARVRQPSRFKEVPVNPFGTPAENQKGGLFKLGSDFGQTASSKEDIDKAISGFQASAYAWGRKVGVQVIAQKVYEVKDGQATNKVVGVKVVFNAKQKVEVQENPEVDNEGISESLQEKAST